eukprot:4424982-Alexandrium_andersonii.AAC.1
MPPPPGAPSVEVEMDVRPTTHCTVLRRELRVALCPDVRWYEYPGALAPTGSTGHLDFGVVAGWALAGPLR